MQENFIGSILLNIGVFLIWSVFLTLSLTPRLKSRWVCVAVLFLAASLAAVAANFLPHRAVQFKAPLAILALTAGSFFAFSDSWVKKLSAVFLAFASTMMAELVGGALMPELIASDNWVKMLDPATLLKAMALEYATTIVMLSFAYLLLNRQSDEVLSGQWRLSAFIPASQYMLLVLWCMKITEQPEWMNTLWLALSVACCLAADISLYFLYSGLGRRSELAEKHSMLARELEDEKRRYAKITEGYQQVRVLRHDLSNYALSVRSLIDAGRADEADVYVNALLERCAAVTKQGRENGGEGI